VNILFDFFGTLVDYSASRTEQGYPRSHAWLVERGATLAYEDFLAEWVRVSEEHDRRSESDDREYSMMDVGRAFLRRVLPTTSDVAAFVDEYIREWNTGVRYPAGVVDVVRGLARDHRLAVVTNTHDAALVPAHLAAMGLSDAFDAVVTSVEVGWRKPHPRIYQAALDALDSEPTAAVFVGDTYLADYDGPRRVGIRAYLIDPDRTAPVPPEARLAALSELPHRLAGYGTMTG
jgi:putative hydrolase of the HAD superfamily